MLLGGSEALDKGESARAAAEGQLPGEVLYSRYRPEADGGDRQLPGNPTTWRVEHPNEVTHA